MAPTPSSHLSDLELAELDRFLASDATSDQTMMIDAIDGYLTALALGPVDMPVDQWLPGIWGPDASHAPRFQNPAQAQRIADLIVRLKDSIHWALDYDPDDIDPIFDTVSYQDKTKEYLDGEMWSFGFIQGIALARSAWQAVFDDAMAMEALLPIYVLGGDDISTEQKLLSNTPSKREGLTRQIPASVGRLWRFWHPEHRPMSAAAAIPVQRSEPKLGRNDPCHCGSGKKWKRCCGAH